MKRKLVTFMLGLSLAAPFAAKADVNDALLKKLVDKGTLTSEEAEEVQSKNPLKGLTIGGVIFLDYSFGQTGGSATTDYNRFSLQRAYININKEITPWFKVRITPDVYLKNSSAVVTSVGPPVKTTSVTSDGYNVRMKYAYADFLTPDMGHLTDTDIRIGLVQTPWPDFEDVLNGYRMQGTMFQDKRGLVTTSDAGVSILGNIGGKLSKEQIADVGNKSYAGKYGSYHIGLYNGGGFGAADDNGQENNQNKAIQGRISVRPLPDMLPGLQLTYFGISGEGNNAAGTPKQWINNTGFVSYQHKYLVASAEYFSGNGNFKGDDESTKSGYSFFGKVVLPMYEKVAFFGRYDLLDPNTDASNNNIETTIAGASYRIHGDNYLVAAYERTHNEANTNPDDTKGQVVLQIAF